jgi:hypothetical protein
MSRTQPLALFSILLALAACGNVRDDLGLGRASPDEFAVVDRAPLSMPPDYTLRPPKPGAPRPQEVDLTQRANDIVFGGDAGATEKSHDESGSEMALLNNAGVAKADPNIRTIVDREAAQKVVGDEHLVEDLLWWKKKGPDTPIVDAPAEAARIKDAQAKGQPLNQSATPVIERQKTGWLGL